MKGENKKNKAWSIDREAHLSSRGVFYYKPVCRPAVVDENGTIITPYKSVKEEERELNKHQF